MKAMDKNLSKIAKKYPGRESRISAPFKDEADMADARKNAPEVFAKPSRKDFVDDVHYKKALKKFQARGNWASE